MAVRWASSLRNSAFIIDWHNFGYTLLGLSLGRNSRFVSVYRWYQLASMLLCMMSFFSCTFFFIIFGCVLRIENRYGKMADGSLCVTKAMQHELAQNWGIK